MAFYDDFYTNLLCSKAFVILFTLEEALMYTPTVVLNVILYVPSLCCLLSEPHRPHFPSSNSETRLFIERRKISSMGAADKRPLSQEQNRVSPSLEQERDSHGTPSPPQAAAAEREMDIFLKMTSTIGYE